MGRNKIEIETRKSLFERKSIFDNRKNGLKKKAKELSILCDAPVMLLFSSPANEKSYELVMGDQCNFEEMVQRYAAAPSKKRYESKVDAFNQLKKAYAKQGKIIDADHDLTRPHHREKSAIEDKQNHLRKLQGEMEEAEKALGVLRYVDEIDNIYDMNVLDEMEATLRAALSQNNTRKDEVVNQFCGTARINQDIYPPQFNEISCAPQVSQVNHQLQSHGLSQVANNVQGQFQLNSAAGTSYPEYIYDQQTYQLSATYQRGRTVEESLNEGYTTMNDGTSCSNITPHSITYREGWSLEDVINMGPL